MIIVKFREVPLSALPHTGPTPRPKLRCVHQKPVVAPPGGIRTRTELRDGEPRTGSGVSGCWSCSILDTCTRRKLDVGLSTF